MSRVLQLVTRDEPGGVRVLARMVEQGLIARGHAVTTQALRDGPVAILRQIAVGRYDAILSYQVAAGLLGSAAGWVARVPLRATHLTAIPSAMRPHWRWLDRLWGRCGIYTTIIANSAATLETIAQCPAGYRRRTITIPHGVVPLSPAKVAPWRERYSIAPFAPMLVSSGRLVEQKNHVIAVAALAQLPAAHLIIAGEGPLREALLLQATQLGVAERLHLVGDLERGQLAGLLAASDVYVFPSTWESFGLAVVEAAMAGVPVVASALPVLREVLAPARDTSLFHEADDPGALAHAVNSLLADYPGNDRRRTSAVAMQKTHAVERMINAYCELLDRAASD